MTPGRRRTRRPREVAPRRALVLAAGLAERLRPLSLTLPKPLMPLWGRPLLFGHLAALRRWGVRDVVINLHHGAADIVHAVRAEPPDGLRVAFSFEPRILGTGGALRRAEWGLDNQPFWILNADIVAAIDPRPLQRLFARERPLAVLWMHPAAGPRTVVLEGHRVRTFTADRPGTPGTATFCGLHLVSPRLLRNLPTAGPASIIAAYTAAMQSGETVLGAAVPGARWADTGTVPGYLDAHGFTNRRKASLGRNVVVRPGACLDRAVVWDNAFIGARARVHDAVIAAGVHVNGPVSGMVLRADAAGDPRLARAIRALGWSPAVTSVNPFPPRGSDRIFARIQCGSRRAILQCHGTGRPENKRYVACARLLHKLGVRVPAVLLSRPADRLAVVEDVGDRSLLDVLPHVSAARRVQLYTAVLQQAARLHRADHARLRRLGARRIPRFTPAVYRWEHELFAAHVLRNRLAVSPSAARTVLRELAPVARLLRREPAVLIHRDLQSSNVHIHRGETVLLDFQGLRLGAAVYDLASLLYDPYAVNPPDLRDT
ncbi:MAG: phosphotransferase, partial [Lentisphaerae bacterium]|nr:phosphotransferase [Lentisphaerota bacterium]